MSEINRESLLYSGWISSFFTKLSARPWDAYQLAFVSIGAMSRYWGGLFPNKHTRAWPMCRHPGFYPSLVPVSMVTHRSSTCSQPQPGERLTPNMLSSIRLRRCELSETFAWVHHINEGLMRVDELMYRMGLKWIDMDVHQPTWGQQPGIRDG